MDNRTVTAVAIAALVIIAVVVGAIVYFTLRLSGHGVIKVVGCGVYADEACTIGVSSIDWGTIAPGAYSQALLYFKSESNVPTNFTYVTENWIPTNAADYLSLTWNYDGTLLEPGGVRAITLTLNVDEQIIGITDFAFDIVVTAAG